MICAMLIGVNVCTSVADGDLGATEGSDLIPFLIVSNAPVITGTIFVLTSQMLLTSIFVLDLFNRFS